MAYKPFKVNKGYYAGATRNKESKYEIARMKLFGFRSGIAWKMIPALLYYSFAIVFIGSSIMGEIREFTFEGADAVLCTLKYIFISIIAFAPAIFLSDFSYRDNIPLFRKRTVSGNIMGMLMVIPFCIFMIWTYQYCMSDTYKASADAYYAEQESIKQQKMDEYESSMKETESAQENSTKADSE